MAEEGLVKNSIYLVLYRLFNTIFPFITSIYIAHVLQADSIGIVAAAQNNVKYFIMVASLGIPTYGVKLIAQYKKQSYEGYKAFWELFSINALLSIISSVIFLISVRFVPYFHEQKWLYYIVGIVIIGNIINVDWYFQGIQQFRYITIRNISIKVISFICIVLFVRRPEHLYIYALICTLAQVGNNVFGVIRLKQYISFVGVNLKFKDHLKHVFALFISSVAVEVYILADTTMLDVMCDSKIVGYYTISLHIINIIRLLVVAALSAFLPQLSFLFHSEQKESFIELINIGVHLIEIISIPIAIGLLLISNDAIILLFGRDYKESVLATQIMAISIIAVAFSNFFGLQILVTLGKERITTISTICGAIVNIVLNFLLIRHLGQNGAAISSAITECVVTVCQIAFVRKYITIKYIHIVPVISAMTMTIVVLIINEAIVFPIVRVIVSIIVGGLVYVGVAYYLKDSLINQAIEKVKVTIGVKK